MTKFIKNHKKLLVGAIIAVVIVVVVIVVMSPRGKPATEFETGVLQKQDISAAVNASGNIKAKSSRNVISMANLQIVKVNAKEGQKVRKGEVLAVLDSDSLSLDAKSAYNAY
jgi:multidrug efflux pump subunit AcrA (membrane-fusion protein)